MDIHEEISLKHKRFLTERFKRMDTSISTYSFANIFLYRHTDHYKLPQNNDCFITGINRKGLNYCIPTEDLNTISPNCLRQMLQTFDFIFPVPEEWLGIFDRHEIAVTFSDQETDYLYITRKLASLRGKAFIKKRHHINQFRKTYKYAMEEFKPTMVTDACLVLSTWQSSCSLTKEETDYFPCLEALNLYAYFDFEGLICYVGNQPVGFLIGQELNDRTFVIHFAKAISEYKGIYEFMFNYSAQILQPRYEFLNFEEDLGRTSLRKAKLSYQPDRMEKKYAVFQKEKALIIT